MRQLSLFNPPSEVKAPEGSAPPDLIVVEKCTPFQAPGGPLSTWPDIDLLRVGTPESVGEFLGRYRRTLEGFDEEHHGLVVAKWMNAATRYRPVESAKLVTWLIYVGNNAIRDAKRKLIRHEIGHKLFQRTTVEADTPYEMFIEADYLAWDFDRVDPDVAELARSVMSGEIEPDQLTDFERQSLRDAWETLQL